jgi:hypothetical protein
MKEQHLLEIIRDRRDQYLTEAMDYMKELATDGQTFDGLTTFDQVFDQVDARLHTLMDVLNDINFGAGAMGLYEESIEPLEKILRGAYVEAGGIDANLSLS